MDNTKFLKTLLAVVEKQQAALKKIASVKLGQSGLKGDPLDFEAANRDLGYPILDSKEYDKPRPAPNPTPPPTDLAPNQQTHFNDAAMGEKIKQELKSPSVLSVGVNQGSGVVTVKFSPNTLPATKDQLFKTLQQVAGRYVGKATVKEVA